MYYGMKTRSEGSLSKPERYFAEAKSRAPKEKILTKGREDGNLWSKEYEFF